jgi:hypothetical protein
MPLVASIGDGMNSRSSLSTVLFATLVVGAAPASAAESLYDFYYGALKVATLKTTDNTAFSFSFFAQPEGSSGAFINDILLDMGYGSFTPDNTDTTPTYEFREKGFEGTGMQTKISFPTEGNGDERFAVGETANWMIGGAFDGPARLHVNAFINGGSVKLTTPVPEPEAYAMALVALGVLGAFRRFRRDKT